MSDATHYELMHLLQDKECVNEVIDELAEDIADDLSDLIEDDPYLQRQLLNRAMKSEGFKERVIHKLIAELKD